MARILIAGCGYVGTALGVALAGRGDTAFALRRRAALLPRGLLPVAADLSDPRTLTALPGPFDAVVYAAAPECGDEAAYERVYVRGLANLLDAIARAHRTAPPQVVLLSSTSVYGQTAGEWVDETSPTEPADFRGCLVLRGEETLDAAGVPGVVLRLGGIYGPGRTSLLDAVRERRARLAPGPPRFTNRIHRDDVVGTLLHLLAPPPGRPTLEPDRTVWIGVDEEPTDRGDVVRWLARRLGVPEGDLVENDVGPSTSSAPACAPAATHRRGRRSDTGKRCSSAKLRASGYRFRFPTFREGYADLLGQTRD